MGRMLMVVLAVVMAAGCGTSDDGGDEGPCTARSGLYKMSFAETDGNCGAVPDSIINSMTMSQSMTGAAACTGTVTQSESLCETTVDQSCPVEGGSRVESVGKVTWNRDSSKGAGVLGVKVWTGESLDCLSTYRVTYTRL